MTLSPKRKPDTAIEVCYRWLVKAGLPELKEGEKIMVRVRIKRLKAGRPKQQAVAIGR